MKQIALFLLSAGLALAGCAASGKSQGDTLTPIQAKDWLAKNPSAQLVDVRTPEEFAGEHLAGAKLIPVQDLESRAGEISRDKPVLLYCHSGRRSRQALELLKKLGYRDPLQIGGGITAWRDQGLPVESGAK